tara:strand:+ start:1524 stop:2114 length:591 start_codon:yes stop_codon:yes gene_type:complete
MSSWANIVSSPSSSSPILPSPSKQRVSAHEKKTPITFPSMCIPWLPTSFSNGQVIDIMNEIGVGEVKEVNLIGKIDRNGDDYLLAFIHMANWSIEGNGKSIRDDLLNDDTPPIKIVYDEPKFLMLSKSFSKRPAGKEKIQKYVSSKSTKTKTYIEDGDTWHVTPSKTKKHNNSLKRLQKKTRSIKNLFSSLHVSDI